MLPADLLLCDCYTCELINVAVSLVGNPQGHLCVKLYSKLHQLLAEVMVSCVTCSHSRVQVDVMSDGNLGGRGFVLFAAPRVCTLGSQLITVTVAQYLVMMSQPVSWSLSGSVYVCGVC